MNDAKNIAGIGQLLVDNNEDMEEITLLEREIIEGAPTQEEDINAAMEYGREMETLSKNFERLSQGGDSTGSNDNNGYSKSATTPRAESEHNDLFDDFKRPITPANAKRSTSISSSQSNSGHAQSPKYQSPPYQSRSSSRSTGGGSDNFEINNERSPISRTKWASKDAHLQKLTLEEQRQMHVNKVLAFAEDKEAEFDIDKERDENEKMSLLEQIDMLKNTLSDDGVDIANVPSVDRNNSLKEIDDVYKILRLKNDRSRCCSLANELILIGAGALENAFDGQKEWFGYTPDLTGWSETVKIKLRRMRYETSTLVQDVMQGYQMGPGWRLLLEIIPSLFLYSRNRRLSANSNLIDDYKFRIERESQQAMSALNSL